MITKAFLFSVMSLAILLNPLAQAHEKKWPERRLRQAWPAAQSFSSKQMSLSPTQIQTLKAAGIEIDANQKSPTFYLAHSKTALGKTPETLGAILFVDKYGSNGPMEISVAMGADGRVKKIDIWEGSEDPLVSRDTFLNQFVGKDAAYTIQLNQDYQPVPKALKASEAIASAANEALQISNLLFKK